MKRICKASEQMISRNKWEQNDDMLVNFEFLDREPIENMITCLHYKVDKVVYFGYRDLIEEYKSITVSFLKKYCGVKDVIFRPLSQKNLNSVLNTMRQEFELEEKQGADIYVDITGGESLILVAFGMLAKEYKFPMHMYDIKADKLLEFDNGTGKKLSANARSQTIKLNIDRYVEMNGGVVNDRLQKDSKENINTAFAEDVEKIWQIAKRNKEYWNPFSDFLKANLKPDENLRVNKKTAAIGEALSASKTALHTREKFDEILNDLAAEEILTDVVLSEESCCFQYKNSKIKECLFEGGSILELHTYHRQKAVSDDCRVGVHLDWDGVIHPADRSDVFNEIDVLSLKGNIPTFISCKSGKMSPQFTLHALYELKTVADRFGGKYAKKVLVSSFDIGQAHLERAAEMGIEVRTADD